MGKKNVPELISAMGLAMEIINRLVKTSRQRGIPDTELYSLATDHGQEVIERMLDVLEEHAKVHITVNYDISLEEHYLRLGVSERAIKYELDGLPYQEAQSGVIETDVVFLKYDVGSQKYLGDAKTLLQKYSLP